MDALFNYCTIVEQGAVMRILLAERVTYGNPSPEIGAVWSVHHDSPKEGGCFDQGRAESHADTHVAAIVSINHGFVQSRRAC